MLELALSFYLLLMLLVCFIRIRVGIAMYLLYSLLVPFVKLFSFGQNLLPVVIIAAFGVNYGYKNLLYKPLLPFLFLYACQFLLIPFHFDVPVDEQLNFFRVSFMSTMLLPFVMINVMQNDKSANSLFKNVLFVGIFIACLYSLFLTTIPGINPYLMTIMPLSGDKFDVGYALAEDEGRMFGRISGVFPHPMLNGLFLSLSAIYLVSVFTETKAKIWKYMIGLMFLIILCTVVFIGVRTAILATIVGLLLYFFLNGRFQILFYGIGLLSILSLILSQISGLNDFVWSIFDSSASSGTGSSLEMRLSQFDGVFNEIRFNPLFGKGYGWTTYYHIHHGDHPVLLSFESLVYVVLCNDGFIGAIIWGLMIYFYVVATKKYFQLKYAAFVLSLFLTYLVYSIVTGEYGYMRYFLIFYVIMWGYGIRTYPLKSKTNKVRL